MGAGWCVPSQAGDGRRVPACQSAKRLWMSAMARPMSTSASTGDPVRARCRPVTRAMTPRRLARMVRTCWVRVAIDVKYND